MLEIEEIGKRIKSIRNLSKISLETLSEETDISVRELSRIEHGKVKSPRIETLYSISKALGITMEHLLDKEYFLEDLQEYFSDYPELIDETRVTAESFYPDVNEDIGLNKVLQFIIYLPLIDIDKLFDVLLRIDGDIFSRERYLVGQINYLIRTIKENNPAKPYADYRASQCSYEHMRNHYEYGVNPNVDEEILRSYIAYKEIIERKREVSAIFFNAFEKYYFERKEKK